MQLKLLLMSSSLFWTEVSTSHEQHTVDSNRTPGKVTLSPQGSKRSQGQGAAQMLNDLSKEPLTYRLLERCFNLFVLARDLKEELIIRHHFKVGHKHAGPQCCLLAQLFSILITMRDFASYTCALKDSKNNQRSHKHIAHSKGHFMGLLTREQTGQTSRH